MRRVTERGWIRAAALLSGGMLMTGLIAGCGGSDFKDKPRPPVPLEITGVITDKNVTVSPAKVPARGPVTLDHLEPDARVSTRSTHRGRAASEQGPRPRRPSARSTRSRHRQHSSRTLPEGKFRGEGLVVESDQAGHADRGAAAPLVVGHFAAALVGCRLSATSTRAGQPFLSAGGSSTPAATAELAERKGELLPRAAIVCLPGAAKDA